MQLRVEEMYQKYKLVISDWVLGYVEQLVGEYIEITEKVREECLKILEQIQTKVLELPQASDIKQKDFLNTSFVNAYERVQPDNRLYPFMLQQNICDRNL